MTKLTINAGPETFTSELPDGVTGNVSLIKNMTVAKVLYIVIENASDYEENMDGEYTIMFKNGDEIRFDGYFGLWELDHYDSLSVKAKSRSLNSLKEHLTYLVENIQSDS